MTDMILLRERVEELLEAKDLRTLREELAREEGADLAELFAELPEERHRLVFRLLPKELAALAFSEMEAEDQLSLIRSFADRELREVLDELYLDDTVDLIEEMPAGVVSRILKNCSPGDRAVINQLLRYDSDSAGGMMTTEYVRLRQQMTVEQAFVTIRRDAYDKESVYTCYVTDESRHLLGLVDVRTLLVSPEDTPLEELMNRDVISLATDTPAEEVALTFEKYNFLAIPICDGEGRLVGIVTVDDAMDVARREVEEDIALMAAVTPTETPYLRTPAHRLFLGRIPWLLLLMLTATFTGMIISGFESALSASVILTAFIPMLMGTGGNSGSQASVTVIRGLSLGEIRLADAGRVLWKELRVSVLCATALGLVTFLKLITLDRLLMGPEVTVTVAATVTLALFATVLLAKLIGCLMPLLAHACRLDPAVMAGPFITTLVDALSLLVYFGVAQSVLSI